MLTAWPAMTLRPSQRQTYAHVGPAVVRLTVSPSAANVKAQGNTRFQHRHPYPRISAYAKGIGWVAGRRDLSGYRHPVTPEVAGSSSVAPASVPDTSVTLFPFFEGVMPCK